MAEDPGDERPSSRGSDSKAMTMSASRGRLSHLREQLEASKAEIAKRDKEKAEMKATIEKLKERASKMSHHFTEPPTGQDEEFVKVRRVSSGSEVSGRSSSEEEFHKQIADLKEIIRDKEEIIKARSRAVELLMEKEGRPINETELVIANGALQTKLDSIEKKLVELEEEKGALQLKLLDHASDSDHSDKGGGMKKRLSKAGPLNDAEIECESLNLKLSECYAKIDALEIEKDKELSQLKKSLKDQEDIVKNLSKEKDKLFAELEKSERDNDGLRQEYEMRLSAKDKEILGLKIELEDCEENSLHEKDEIIEELKEELEKVKQELYSKDEQVSNRESELEAIVNRFKSDLEASERREEEAVSDFEKKFKELRDRSLSERSEFEDLIQSLRDQLSKEEGKSSEVVELKLNQNRLAEANRKLEELVETLKNEREAETRTTREKMSKFEEEKNRTRAYIEELEQAILDKESDAVSAQEAFGEIREAYERNVDELNHLRSKLEDVQSSSDDSQNFEEVIKKLTAELKKKEALINDLKEESDKMTEQLDEENNNLRTELEVAKREVLELKASVDRDQQFLASSSNRISELEASLRDEVNVRLQLEQQLSAIGASQLESSKLDQELNQLRSQLADVTRSFEQERSEKAALLDEVAKLSQSNHELEQLRQQVYDLSQSNQELEQLRHQVSQLSQPNPELEQLRQQVSQLRSQLESSSSDADLVRTLRDQVARKDQQLDSLEEDFSKSREHLETEIKDMSKELKSKDNQLAELSKQVNDLKKFSQKEKSRPVATVSSVQSSGLSDDSQLIEKLKKLEKELEKKTQKLESIEEDHVQEKEEMEIELQEMAVELKAREKDAKELAVKVASLEIQVKNDLDNLASANEQLKRRELEVAALLEQTAVDGQAAVMPIHLERRSTPVDNEEVTRLNHKLEAIEKEKKNLIERLQLTEADREAVTEQFVEISEELELLKESLANKKDSKGDPEAQAKFDSLNEEFSKLTAEKTKLQETVNSAKKKLKELSSNVKKLTEEKKVVSEQLNQQLVVVTSESTAKDDRIAELEGALEGLQAAVTAMSTSASSDVQQLNEELARLRDVSQLSEKRIVEREEQIAAIEVEFAKLRSDAEQLRQKNVDQERWFNNEIEELRNSLVASAEAMQDKDRRNEELEMQIQQLNQQSSSSPQPSDEVQALHDRIAEILNESAVIQDSVSAKDVLIEELAEQKRQYESEVNSVREELAIANQQISQITSELNDVKELSLKKDEMTKHWMDESEKLSQSRADQVRSLNEKDRIIDGLRRDLESRGTTDTSKSEEMSKLIAQKDYEINHWTSEADRLYKYAEEVAGVAMSKDQLIEELQLRVSEFEATLNSSATELESSKETIKKSESQFADERSKWSELEKELRSTAQGHQKSLEEKETLINELKSNLVSGGSSVDSLTKQLAAAQSKLIDLEAKFKAVEKESSMQEAEMQTLIASKDALVEQLQERTSVANAKDEDIEELQQQLSDMKSKLSEAEKTADDLRQELLSNVQAKASSDDLKEISAELIKVKAQLKRKDLELSEKKKDVERLEKERQQVEDVATQVAGVQDSMTSMEDQLRTLEDEKTKLSFNLQVIEQERQQWSSEIEKLKNLIVERDSQLEQLAKERSEEKNSFAEKLTAAYSQVSQLEERVTSGGVEEADGGHDHDHHNIELQTLVDARDSLAHEKKALLRKAEENEFLLTELRNQLEMQTQELVRVKTEMDSKQLAAPIQEVPVNDEKLKDLQTELVKAKAQIAKKDNEFKKLKSEVSSLAQTSVDKDLEVNDLQNRLAAESQQVEQFKSQLELVEVHSKQIETGLRSKLVEFEQQVLEKDVLIKELEERRRLFEEQLVERDRELIEAREVLATRQIETVQLQSSPHVQGQDAISPELVDQLNQTINSLNGQVHQLQTDLFNSGQHIAQLEAERSNLLRARDEDMVRVRQDFEMGFRQQMDAMLTQIEFERRDFQTRTQHFEDKLRQAGVRHEDISSKLKEAETRAKKLASKLKAKESELQLVNEAASSNLDTMRNVDLDDRVGHLEEQLRMKDALIEEERGRRAIVEDEMEKLWRMSRSAENQAGPPSGVAGFDSSIVIDEETNICGGSVLGSGSCNRITAAWRWFNWRRQFFLRDIGTSRYKKLLVVFYFAILHFFLLKAIFF